MVRLLDLIPLVFAICFVFLCENAYLERYIVRMKEMTIYAVICMCVHYVVRLITCIYHLLDAVIFPSL